MSTLRRRVEALEQTNPPDDGKVRCVLYLPARDPPPEGDPNAGQYPPERGPGRYLDHGVLTIVYNPDAGQPEFDPDDPTGLREGA